MCSMRCMHGVLLGRPGMGKACMYAGACRRTWACGLAGQVEECPRPLVNVLQGMGLLARVRRPWLAWASAGARIGLVWPGH